MASIILVTGGGRSGKSGYALRRAEALPGPRVFIATCPVLDDEMRERVRRHREERAHATWRTVEEQTDLAGALRDTATANVRIIDCLTLWINNLMFEAEQQQQRLSEDIVAAACQRVIGACEGLQGTVILVTNEVGMGIIPENALARQFRDLAGRANQVLAGAAAEVVLMVSGLPLKLKSA